MSQPAPGYAAPDWEAPIDVAAQIAGTPENSTVKGLFFQDVRDACATMGSLPPEGRARYVPFIDYPMREYMDLVVAAAALVHPREPLRNGLRRLGRLAYPALARTLVGRTLFGVAGRDFGVVLSLASRAYAFCQKPGDVTLVERAEGRAKLRLRQIWNFPDTYQVGVFEGGLITLGLRGVVQVRVLSPCDVDFEVTWQG